MNAGQYQMMRVVQKIPIFKGFEVREVVLLLKICHSAMYQVGHKIYEIGGRSDEMLILLKGKLNVIGSSGETLASIDPGNAIGEMGLFTGQPRSATIVAAESCAALTIRKAELVTLLSNNKEMYIKLLYNLIGQLSKRLAEANRLNSELQARVDQLDGGGKEADEGAAEVLDEEEEEEEYPGDAAADEDDEGLEYDRKGE